MSDASCGTYAAAMLHKKRKERLDGRCRRAVAAYTRNWRNRDRAVRGTGWPARLSPEVVPLGEGKTR